MQNYGQGSTNPDGTITQGPGAHANGTGNPLQKPRNKMMISKNDKRRHYAKMYSEAFNSGDPKQLLNFLEQYCTPDCVVIQRCVVKENPFIPKYLEIHGIQAIHQFWSNTFIIIPDCLIVMLETKLRIRNRHPHGPPPSNTHASSSTTTSSQTNLANYEATGGNFPQNSPGDVASSSNATTASSTSPNTSTNTSLTTSHNEGSSIVSSFSFTGTKIYTMDMEGAVLQDENIQTLTAANSAASDFQHANTDSNSSTVQALIAKSQQRVNKKRAHNADWPNNSAEGSSAGGSSTALSTGQEAPSNNTVDRYNIFLHPPRRFSTLAGTPFGGNASHYTNHSAKQYSALTSLQRAAVSQPNMFSVGNTTSNTRVSDYVSINANTKLRAGKLIDKEGLINFLGTLTMTLDGENKIAKFEFLYSHLD